MTKNEKYNLQGIPTVEQLIKDSLFNELDQGINLYTKTIYLTYDIDGDALCHLISRLDQLKNYNLTNTKNITIIISSYGGDIYSMLGIIDYIKNLDVKVNTICYGAAMSATAVILACGTGERIMSKNSTLMLHEGSVFQKGKHSDIMKTSDHMKKLQKNIYKILEKVTNKDASFWSDMMKTDTYLTPKECLNYGLIDKIV